METQRQHKIVAIYARVSTEHESQISALENQIEWYKEFLKGHPEWEVYNFYVDRGITGTSAKKRPQFLQMIEDAKNGEFDLICTRETSRWARNTVDALSYTRELSKYNVEVFFINDGIWSMSPDGELRLSIMASLSQDESRRTSVRVKAGQQISMKSGTYFGNGNILGYDRVGKSLLINPEQAKTVRTIYDLYLSGYSQQDICVELEKRNLKNSSNNTKWVTGTINYVLHNSFYCGIIEYHKKYSPDFLNQSLVKRNRGEIEKIYIKGSHETIVSEEEYKRVQEILKLKTSKRKTNIIGIKQKKTFMGQTSEM